MKAMPVSNLKMPKWVAAGRILLNSYCITHKFQLEKGSFFSTLQIEPYPKVLTIWNTCWTITKSIVLVSNEFLWNLSQKFKLSKWPIKPFFWIFESICGKVGIFLSFTCLKYVCFMVLSLATWYNYSKVSKHTCPTLWGIQYHPYYKISFLDLFSQKAKWLGNRFLHKMILYIVKFNKPLVEVNRFAICKRYTRGQTV